MARKAPPRRLELRSSAPEADTLSTELRGRATKFYHIVCSGGQLPAATFLCFCGRRERKEFGAQLLDDAEIASLVTDSCKLFLLVGEFAADLIEASRFHERARGQRGKICVGLEKGKGADILSWRDIAFFHLFAQLSFQYVALTNNHPDNKSNHERVTNVIHKCAYNKTTDPANQPAERVVEGMRHNCNDISRRDSHDLDQRVTTHARNGESDASK